MVSRTINGGGFDDVSTAVSRPASRLAPTEERALLALQALVDQRFADAEKHTKAIPDRSLIDRAWKELFNGWLAVKRGKLAAAEPDLLQAITLSLACGLEGRGDADPNALRLAALAVNHLGWVYRRQDRPSDAYRVHLTAYHLRKRYGDNEEQWETAVELGLDASLARRIHDMRCWHHTAVMLAHSADDEPLRKEAVAWSSLSTCLAENGLHEEAVAAARTARQAWHRHDITAASAVQADLHLGTVLLQQGQTVCDNRNASSARPILQEALQWLTAAHESLLAFGPSQAIAAKRGREQIDFVQRLLAALDL